MGKYIDSKQILKESELRVSSKGMGIWGKGRKVGGNFYKKSYKKGFGLNFASLLKYNPQ